MLPFLFGDFMQKWYIPQGTNGPAGRILIGDADRDENYEFYIRTYGESQKIYVYELYLPDTWEVDSFSYLYSPLLWDTGDFDLDGLWDLAIQASATQSYPTMVISIAESPDSFSYPIQEVWRDTVGFPLVQPISAYDVDNDGYPEILDNNGNGQPHFFWIYEAIGNNQYDTVYTTNPDTTLLDGPVSTHAFGDFDNDGKIEFAMGGMSAGALGATYWIYESPANNIYEQVTQGYVPTKNIKDCFSVSDADGDGKMEFVVKGFTPPDGRTHAFIFEATGDNTYEIIKSFNLAGGDYYGGYSEAGDVDGDSIPEIVLESASYVYIIKAAGNDSFYVWDTLPGHASGSCVRIFDIDENGLAEIIISGNNETRIYEYDAGGMEEARSQKQEARYRLEVYPNPFREKTRISYCVGRSAKEVGQGFSLANSKPEGLPYICIYDVSGRLVRQFDYPTIKQSDHIIWYGDDENGRVVAQGVYFIRIENLDTKEILVQKVLKILSRQ